jgi:hypothetical protein
MAKRMGGCMKVSSWILESLLARLDICEWTYPTSAPTAEQLDALAYVVGKSPAW